MGRVGGGLAPGGNYRLINWGSLLVREALGLLYRWVPKDLQPRVVLVVVQVDVFYLAVSVVVLRVSHLLPAITLICLGPSPFLISYRWNALL